MSSFKTNKEKKELYKPSPNNRVATRNHSAFDATKCS